MSDEQQPLRSHNVRELSFMGPSNDGKRLLLVADDGTQFELVVDSRLISVVSREHGPATRAPSRTGTTKMPSPRDIQDQIRHGATVEQIAEAAGVSADAIANFAYPVITERAHIADQARQVPVKVGTTQIPLEEAVLDRIKTRAVDTRLVRWDAWRREDSTWTVIAAYPANQGERIATFIFDSKTKTITAVDDESRWILEVSEVQTQVEAAADAPFQRPRPHMVPNNSSPAAQPTRPPAAAPRPEQAKSESNQQPRSWDRAHPAARAHERREANADARSQSEEASPEASSRVNREHPAATESQSANSNQTSTTNETQKPASPAPAPAPARRTEETPQWEELLFGSPQHDDSN